MLLHDVCFSLCPGTAYVIMDGYQATHRKELIFYSAATIFFACDMQQIPFSYPGKCLVTIQKTVKRRIPTTRDHFSLLRASWHRFLLSASWVILAPPQQIAKRFSSSPNSMKQFALIHAIYPNFSYIYIPCFLSLLLISTLSPKSKSWSNDMQFVQNTMASIHTTL